MSDGFSGCLFVDVISHFQIDVVRVKEMQEERKLETGEENGEVEKDEVTASTASLMEKLSKYIYTKDDSMRIRTRAMLCHVYFHALHDRWYAARDLMLMSHLQENIQHSDIPTQVSYPGHSIVENGGREFNLVLLSDVHAVFSSIYKILSQNQ